MAGIYSDLEPELKLVTDSFKAIYSEESAKTFASLGENTTWVMDWVKEEMPECNEINEGNGLERGVRKMLARSSYSMAPEIDWERPTPENVLVFSDQAGFCQKILEKVPFVDKVKVVKKPARLLTKDDCMKMLSKATYDLVIFGCPLDPPKSSKVADVISQQTAVDKLCFNLLQAIQMNEGACKRLAVLTHDAFSEQPDSHNKRGLSIVTASTLFGMLNTARVELENVPIQLIDTEFVDTDMIPELASELFRKQSFGQNFVRHCYPDPVRNRIRSEKPYGRHVYRQLKAKKYEESADCAWDVASEGVIAISGGNGALGLVMGRWILDRAQQQIEASRGAYTPKFSIQFLSRSAKVGDMNQYLWEQVQKKASALGVTVMQGKVDMGSQEAVDKFITEVSPNLVGFIHSAGVLQDGMLIGQTWEKFETVYESKHRAAFYLHDSLERIPNPNLAFMWLFSSTAAFGSMGQINYSASNACLDGLARHRAALGKPCTAIHWGAWGEVGMAATLDEVSRNRFMKGPVPYFSVAQGLQGLEEGIRTGFPEFVVYIVNPVPLAAMVKADYFSRNFMSEFFPSDLPDAFEQGNTYQMYRMLRYVFAPYLPQDDATNECINWKTFAAPRIEARKPKRDDSDHEVISVDFL